MRIKINKTAVHPQDFQALSLEFCDKLRISHQITANIKSCLAVKNISDKTQVV